MKKTLIGICLICLGINSSSADTLQEKLVSAAFERTKDHVVYDPAYVSIAYPNGDVPLNTGVCTDVIIRAYRKIGLDFQKLIHEDMRENFSKYPKIWGLKKPDRNIDHRRVPNIQTFLKRQQANLTITKNLQNYQAGDLITWVLPGNLPHIGIVSDKFDQISKNPLIIHNLGNGVEIEDFLFSFPITGHYRYFLVSE